jgi:hypothetical protein
VAVYHTQWNNPDGMANEEFSYQDIITDKGRCAAYGLCIPDYMSTPSAGIKRYDGCSGAKEEWDWFEWRWKRR